MVEIKKRSIPPANFFLIAGLLVGLFYCIVIPYGAGFDEERHLVRIYYMSKLEFMPNFPDPRIHEDVADLSYQRRLVQTPAFDMFERETFLRRFSTFDKYRYGQRTQSIYSPVIFLPQAMIGRLLWWKYDFPILPTILLQKIAGLLIYIAGAYVMIRAAPYGKWILAAVALLPAAMYQASTLNADGFTAAVSFAFIGYVVATYVNEGGGIRPRSVWILAGLAVLLGTAKPGAIILLPLLLILIKHPLPSKKWIAVLILGVLLSAAANIGWWAVASQGSVFSGEGVQSVSQQSSAILSDPLGFIEPLIQGMVLTFPDQVKGWIAAYGYWAGTVPAPVYTFSLIFLAASLLAEPRVKIHTGARLFLIGMFLFCCISIYTIAFAPNYVTGGVLALAKHGRYYIPFAPLLFLGIAGSFEVRPNLGHFMKRLAVVSFLLVTFYFSFGIYTTYYTYCGYNAYTGDRCVLPVYKNLEKENGNTEEIRDGERLNQTFTNDCGKLEDVQVFVTSIPASPGGSLRFSLLDPNGQVLDSRDYAPAEIIPGSYLSLPVELPPKYRNRDFEIELEAMDLPSPETFSFMVVPRDYYPGRLSKDGEAVRRNLLIHYTCATP
ncbi:MAG: hypothetical protein C3F07_11035 [Anaerolineales bacterium]|nr:MAG: hypothetical protein C3F07_11035 [Anaerolineales bacterium]